MTLLMGSNIVLEAFVSCLNFGIGADQTSWGNALSNAQNALILGNWWWAFFPGMAIALTVIAINSSATGCATRSTHGPSWTDPAGDQPGNGQPATRSQVVPPSSVARRTLTAIVKSVRRANPVRSLV